MLESRSRSSLRCGSLARTLSAPLEIRLHPAPGILSRESPEKNLVEAVLGDVAKKVLEALMKNQTIPVLGPTAKRLLAESEAKGEAKGRAESILLLLKAKGVIVDEPSRTRILDCRDSQVLDRWLLRGLQISSVQDLFTED